MSAADVVNLVFGSILVAGMAALFGSIFGAMLAAVHNMIIEDFQRDSEKYTWHPFRRVGTILRFPLRPFRSRVRKLEERHQRALMMEARLSKHAGKLAPDDPWRPYFDTLKAEATRKRETISTDLKQAVAQGYAKKLKEIGE